MLNMNLWQFNLVQELEWKPDWVMMTGFEGFYDAVKETAALCRSLGIKTMLGGAMASLNTVEMAGYVDVLVTGEGEDVLAQALHTERGIIVGGKVKEINSIPWPDYDGFEVREYHKRNKETCGVKHMGVITSRGCPFACEFCSGGIIGKFQFRDVKDVLAEVAHYKRTYDPDVIMYNDNTFNVRKDKFIQYCRGMKEIGMPWNSAIRLDLLDDEMAREAADGGLCRYFIVGVESFRQDKLDRMNKHLKVEDMKRGLDLLHKYNLNYHANILVGLPGETVEEIIEEVMTIPKDYRVFPILVQPFIGTKYQTRSITPTQEAFLDKTFRAWATEAGLKHAEPEG